MLVRRTVRRPLSPRHLTAKIHGRRRTLRVCFLDYTTVSVSRFVRHDCLGTLNSTLGVPRSIHSNVRHSLRRRGHALTRWFHSLSDLGLAVSNCPRSRDRLGELVFSIYVAFSVHTVAYRRLDGSSPISLTSPIDFTALVEYFGRGRRWRTAGDHPRSPHRSTS